MKRSVLLFCGFFIIVLDLRLTKLVRACRETGFNFLYTFPLTSFSFYRSSLLLNLYDRQRVLGLLSDGKAVLRI